MSPEVWITAGAALVGALLGGVVSFLLQRRQFQHELKLLREEKKAEFAAEDAARRMLMHGGYENRSLGAIRNMVGGFDQDLDGLRKILLQAGARRVQLGTEEKGYLDEKWRLVERDAEYVARLKSKHDPE